MLQGLFKMFRNDATGTLHNCRIAYDLRYNQLKKSGIEDHQCHAMGLAQMAENFFTIHKRDVALLRKANLALTNSDHSIQVFPFAYTFAAQGKEACAQYFAWLKHGLQMEIDEELVSIAVRRGLAQIHGEGHKEKLAEAIASRPAWLAFAPEWVEKAKSL